MPGCVGKKSSFCTFRRRTPNDSFGSHQLSQERSLQPSVPDAPLKQSAANPAARPGTQTQPLHLLKPDLKPYWALDLGTSSIFNCLWSLLFLVVGARAPRVIQIPLMHFVHNDVGDATQAALMEPLQEQARRHVANAPRTLGPDLSPKIDPIG